MKEMNFLNYGFDAYLTLNGQVCLDSNLETLFGSPMEGDNLRAMVDIFESREVPAILISKDRMYINFVNDAVQSAHREIHTSIPQSENMQANRFIWASSTAQRKQKDRS